MKNNTLTKTEVLALLVVTGSTIGVHPIWNGREITGNIQNQMAYLHGHTGSLSLKDIGIVIQPGFSTLDAAPNAVNSALTKALIWVGTWMACGFDPLDSLRKTLAGHTPEIPEGLQPSMPPLKASPRLGVDERNELHALREWKRQMLQMESMWDVQAVGHELSMPLGSCVRAQILPAIRNLKKCRQAAVDESNTDKRLYLDLQVKHRKTTQAIRELTLAATMAMLADDKPAVVRALEGIERLTKY